VLTSIPFNDIDVVKEDEVGVVIVPPDPQPLDDPRERIHAAMQCQSELLLPFVMLVNAPEITDTSRPKHFASETTSFTLLYQRPLNGVEIFYEKLSGR
jgi:hypothetical protein